VLTDTLSIKRVRPLDVLQEGEAGSAADTDAEARFASDFVLMTGELSSLLAATVESLGGPLPDARLDAKPEGAKPDGAASGGSLAKAA
jgi:recombination associated protein RdgC